MTTIQVVHLSARPTIFAFEASADCTSLIIRRIELSSPTFTAFMSKAPNWFTIPLETSSPTVLSTERDSPVITAWFIEVLPDIITPSTGMLSPGRTLTVSPTLTSPAGIIFSLLSVTTLAVSGVRRTRSSIPSLAFFTVSSSSSPPSYMMNATSPAAKSSPMHTDAMRAIETSTSAFMSNAVTSPITASSTIGTPESIMAI